MSEFYALQVRNRHGLLCAVMEAMYGGATMSLEGQLAGGSLLIASIPGARSDETGVLSRSTTAPLQDFVILPIESDTLELIRTNVISRLTLDGRDVIHIQIAKNGRRVFSTYELDYPDIPCYLGTVVPEALVKQWVSRGFVRSYELRQEDGCSERKQDEKRG